MSDIVEVSTALLKRYMEFTRKLTPEELAAISAGELRFALVPIKKTGGSIAGADAAVVSADLANMSSRENAASYVDGLKLTVPQLKQLAKDLGVSITGAGTKPLVRDRIVEHCVGHRLNSQTIRGGTWSTD
jgi:hypothetical protein